MADTKIEVAVDEVDREEAVEEIENVLARLGILGTVA